MEEYKDKINERCALFGINPDILTDIEREKVIEEIKASERGELVCKSVLMTLLKRNYDASRNS